MLEILRKSSRIKEKFVFIRNFCKLNKTSLSTESNLEFYNGYKVLHCSLVLISSPWNKVNDYLGGGGGDT